MRTLEHIYQVLNITKKAILSSPPPKHTSVTNFISFKLIIPKTSSAHTRANPSVRARSAGKHYRVCDPGGTFGAGRRQGRLGEVQRRSASPKLWTPTVGATNERGGRWPLVWPTMGHEDVGLATTEAPTRNRGWPVRWRPNPRGATAKGKRGREGAGQGWLVRLMLQPFSWAGLPNGWAENPSTTSPAMPTKQAVCFLHKHPFIPTNYIIIWMNYVFLCLFMISRRVFTYTNPAIYVNR
jgi:hypothetical protein